MRNFLVASIMIANVQWKVMMIPSCILCEDSQSLLGRYRETLVCAEVGVSTHDEDIIERREPASVARQSEGLRSEHKDSQRIEETMNSSLSETPCD